MGFPCSSVSKESAWHSGNPGSIPGSGRSPGEGSGNPLQYSCLENPMDIEAWWATVHGVTKSRTSSLSLIPRFAAWHISGMVSPGSPVVKPSDLSLRSSLTPQRPLNCGAAISGMNCRRKAGTRGGGVGVVLRVLLLQALCAFSRGSHPLA